MKDMLKVLGIVLMEYILGAAAAFGMYVLIDKYEDWKYERELKKS